MNSDTIQRRLEAQALEVPGLAGHPQIKPLIKWVSDALAVLYAELDAARADLYQSLVERIFPEPEGRAFPAHAIAQLRPSEPYFECSTDWYGVVDKTPIYFSPIRPVKVFDVSIMYQATFQTLTPWQNGRKMPMAELAEPLPSHCLYIAIEVAEDVENLDGLTLYFDKLPVQKQILLPLFRFFCNGKNIETAMGLPVLSGTRPPFPDAEYLRLERLRKQIISGYESRLLHLKSFNFRDLSEDTCPVALKTYLPEKEEKQRLVWLEVHLPDGLLPEDFEVLEIRANCFPAWNARMMRQRGTYPDGAAIIPLANEEERTPQHFLGIQGVWSDLQIFGPSELALSGRSSYGLQSGYIGAFNHAELARRTDSLLQMMETYGLTDFGAFAAEHAYEMGYENLSEVLGQLKADIQQLKRQLAYIPPKAKQPHYYLHLRGIGSELVYFDYFTTQGGQAASQLWPFELNLIPGERETASFKSACLLETPSGGRDALTLSEREALIRGKLSESFNKN